ncbi:alpha-1-antitrypsin-like protein GS55-MS [Chiloscyllium plagiosum]|uniref:alpha-1-antitrypsin-like protein GS55-MS n=1 Tax=Chiloscyllium plagiosum TaxID=36176 RepID=UPI001CB7E66D|nr:alpha-1-antitrypsin-like protein GS55-MS [Chiloscyllium plagiosum]
MRKLIPVALLLTVLYSGRAISSGKMTAMKATIQQAHSGSRTKNNLSALKLSAANTDFALRLYRQIASQPSSTSKNIFFSPISISSSLAMLSLGAKHNTLNQLLRVLGYSNMSKNDAAEVHATFRYLLQELTSENSELHMMMGSSLHIQQGLSLQKKFLDDTRQFYKAETVSTDFRVLDKAKRKINAYVRKQTNGKIQEFIKTLNRNTVMVLINYILFKGKWVKPFDPQKTYEDDFHVDDTTTVKVQMMKRKGRYYMNYDEELRSSVILIPYRGNASLVLILPERGKLAEVEQNLTITNFQNLITSSRIGSVDLRLPKLSLRLTYQLKQLLITMGLVDIFTNNANLSKITKSGPVHVSKVIHEAVLDVDERGTEATAVTGVGLMPMSKPPQLKFNRPFLLLIAEHSSKSVLFAGRVMNPTD